MRLRAGSFAVALVAALASFGCSNTESPTEPSTTGRFGTLVVRLTFDIPQGCPSLGGVGIYVDGVNKATPTASGAYRFDLPGGWHDVAFFSATAATNRIFVPEGGTATVGLTVAATGCS